MDRRVLADKKHPRTPAVAAAGSDTGGESNKFLNSKVMNKYKYFHWNDPYMGFGVGPALYYIEARSREDARTKLMRKLGFRHDPHFIDGDVIEVKEFVQPKPIKIIK